MARTAALADSRPKRNIRRPPLERDGFEIAIPGVTGGAPFAPFAVQTVNGVDQIALVPNALPDGGVGIRALAKGAIGNYTYFDSTDVNRTHASWWNSGSGASIISGGASIAANSALLIDIDTTATSSAPTTEQGGTVSLKINGSVVKSWGFGAGSANYWYNRQRFAGRYIATGLAAGDVTIEFDYTIDNFTASTETIIFSTPSVIVQEIPNANVVASSTSITTSATYVASTVGGTSGAFSGASIGTANADRLVVVAVGHRSGLIPSPYLTIGGVSANLINWGNYADIHVSLFALPVASGTTADIVFDPSTSMTDCIISVYRLIALNKTKIQTNAAVSSSTNTQEFITAVGQVLVLFAYGDAAITGYTGTWSGADTVHERVDAATGGTPSARYAAYDIAFTEAVDKIFSTAEGGGPSAFLTIGATWR